MTRVVIGYFFILASVLIWVLVPFELANYVSAGMVCFSFFLGFVDLLTRRTKGVVFLSVSVLSLMLALMYFVRVKADAVALNFIENTGCRVGAESLLALGDGWSKDGAQIRKSVRLYGATRELRYQENGLFRYGFVGDKSRTVWLEKCE